MSYNIRLNLASDGPNAWPHRKEEVAGMIRSYSADLVGLQEALPDQLEDFAVLLPEYGRFGAGRSSDRTGEHCDILYRKDRFEVLEHDTFWLSETPDIAGSKGWDAALERIVTWARLRDRKTGETFFHFNTHFDHVGPTAREESARLLVRTIDRMAGSGAVVLTGDINEVPQSEPAMVLREGRLVDAMEASRCPHQGPAATWNGFDAIEPERRIDFIFVRGPVVVLRHAILPDTFGGRFPSDHLPVLSELTIGEAETPAELLCEPIVRM